MTATSTIPASPEGQTGATYRITAADAHYRHELPDTFVVKLPAGAAGEES